MNVQEIVNLWEIEQPEYENLGKIVHDFIKSNITEYELLPEIVYRTKDILSIIKKIKKKQINNKDYSFNSLSDKLGIRIICTFQEEMSIIDNFLIKNFSIKKSEYKQENLNFDKLDYISNHYDATINASLKEFVKHRDFENFIFEIQVRTLNQHAWSNTAHSLSYKQEAELPIKFKRKVYRLLSLYEIADDEFSIVNKALKEHQDNPVYTLLRRLEGKFIKFARFDYDRETSLNNIKILLSYIEIEDTKKELLKSIDKFILDNELKIQRIYDENRNRFFEILFLTQPEIFIIWYMLVNCYYAINDNWGNDFDIEDLEQIKTLWGKEL